LIAAEELEGYVEFPVSEIEVVADAPKKQKQKPKR
jgi:hypothetical protein